MQSKKARLVAGLTAAFMMVALSTPAAMAKGKHHHQQCTVKLPSGTCLVK